MSHDAFVVGGGPAGCAAALFAARAGLRVLLVERAKFPRPKPCGEGLMPAGVAVLKELGVWDRIDARPFRGVRYRSARGRVAEGRFPSGCGYGISRLSFDDQLWRAASEHPLIEARDGAAPPPPAALTAYCVGGGPGRGGRYGLSALYEETPACDFVEVFLADGAELYLTPLPGGMARLAVLTEDPRPGLDGFISRCPALRAKLGRRTGEVLGRRLGAPGEAVIGPDWLRAGDAAGALDPIIGDGMAAALQTGKLAGEALAAAAAGDCLAFARYEERRRSLLRARSLLAGAVLLASRRAWSAEAAVSLLGRAPRLFDAALSLF